jgi:predicted dehydrogenase
MGLRVAIVGCGKIADGHVEEVQKLAHLARVVAVCDREELMAEQLALRHGIAAHYSDFDRLLAVERPDVVHVATPPASHLAVATQALRAGCHVYVEKPLTVTHADTTELLTRARTAGRKLTAGYTYLFDPPALAVQSLLARGVLGEPVHLDVVYGYDLGGAFGAAVMSDPDHWVHDLPGQVLQNNLDHLLNRLIGVLPDQRPEVRAWGGRWREASFGDRRDALYDELRLLVVGQRVTAHCLLSSRARPVAHALRLYGTRASVQADFVARTVTLNRGVELPSALGRLVPAFDQALQYAHAGASNLLRFARSDFHFFAGLGTLLRRFYESISNGTEPPIAYADLLRISAMANDVWGQLDRQRAAERTAS